MNIAEKIKYTPCAEVVRQEWMGQSATPSTADAVRLVLAQRAKVKFGKKQA